MTPLLSLRAVALATGMALVVIWSAARAHAAEPPSWVFQPSTFTHDPESGARVAQYMRRPPVEPLADQRNVTSRYRRTRTNLRGPHGSIDSSYQVQAWGNDRGGLDAQWERFHDAWKESILQGGFYYGPASPWGGGYGGPGFGFPSTGYPGQGFPPSGYPRHHGPPHRRHGPWQ